ncbi:unnamed protein product [Cladocopium goreaui]|uniref:Uncharacterized protein n=1 Tax=Cladocopium goreaui TaxID=2562237 RepID=A0A9P1FVJ3_9DINO|nr:unnamed protein product [Cladocopium goreaui]
MAPVDELEALLRKLPESSQELVQESYAQIGHEISHWDAPALLLDVFLPGAPVVGASQGFHQRSEHFPAGFWRPRSLGQSVLQVLLKGVDECHISRSMCQDVENFLRMARLRQLCSMADCVVSHPFHFKGEVLQIKSCFQLLKVKQWHDEGEHNLVLCLLDMDGCKLRLSSQISEQWPNPALFPVPLSNKCIMLKCMSSAMRREAHLPRGCVCLSHREIHEQQDGSYFFSISVDGTLNSWTSRLPFLGFTCTSPQEIQAKRYFFGDLPHSYCLGDSVHIGGAAEAWLRRGASRAAKLREAVETGAERQLLVPLPDHRRVAPFVPRPGDVLGCRYRKRQAGGVEGSQISLFLNGSLAFEFDLTTELPSGKPLYAVVDVCHCVYQVTMLPNAEDRLMGS